MGALLYGELSTVEGPPNLCERVVSSLQDLRGRDMSRRNPCVARSETLRPGSRSWTEGPDGRIKSSGHAFTLSLTSGVFVSDTLRPVGKLGGRVGLG